MEDDVWVIGIFFLCFLWEVSAFPAFEDTIVSHMGRGRSVVASSRDLEDILINPASASLLSYSSKKSRWSLPFSADLSPKLGNPASFAIMGLFPTGISTYSLGCLMQMYQIEFPGNVAFSFKKKIHIGAGVRPVIEGTDFTFSDFDFYYQLNGGLLWTPAFLWLPVFAASVTSFQIHSQSMLLSRYGLSILPRFVLGKSHVNLRISVEYSPFWLIPFLIPGLDALKYGGEIFFGNPFFSRTWILRVGYWQKDWTAGLGIALGKLVLEYGTEQGLKGSRRHAVAFALKW